MKGSFIMAILKPKIVMIALNLKNHPKFNHMEKIGLVFSNTMI